MKQINKIFTDMFYSIKKKIKNILELHGAQKKSILNLIEKATKFSMED